MHVYMGVSENSVPLNPMVLLIIIPFLNGYSWEYTLFSDKPIWMFLVFRIQAWPRSRDRKRLGEDGSEGSISPKSGDIGTFKHWDRFNDGYPLVN